MSLAFDPAWPQARKNEWAAEGARQHRAAQSVPSAPEQPLPLFPSPAPAEPYPVAALGSVLGAAAVAIASKVQCPLAIAGSSVLAAAALCAQAHRNVLLPYGQTRPLSLFMASVAASGDRKTTADYEACWPIRQHEKNLRREFDEAIAEHRIKHAAHQAQRRKIESDRGLELLDRESELRALGPEPEPPLHPVLTAPDPTVEGLAKLWPTAPASLGIFSAEGGTFTGGHGMNADNRLKTGAALSELWDGKPMRRLRAGDGLTILHGRRLSLHVMLQPDVAAGFLSDPVARDQGLLSRILIAAPASISGTRLYRDTRPEDDAAIRAYGARLLALLEAPWPFAEGKRNELVLPVLALSSGAMTEWKVFFDHVEKQSNFSGNLDQVKDFAAKAAEQAARVAGVLTVVRDHCAVEIAVEEMSDAVVLLEWHVGEALRLACLSRIDLKLNKADKLLQWLKSRPREATSMRTILQSGPSATRQKSAAEDATKVLLDHGWLVATSERPKQFQLAKGI